MRSTRLRLRRAQAIIRENETTLRWLQSAKGQAQIHQQTEEGARIGRIIEHLEAETARLRKDGDRELLLPTTAEQLRTLLVGSEWAINGERGKAYEFQEGGVLRSSKKAIQYVILDHHTIAIIWSAGSKINCEFSEDFTTFREMSGEKHEWKRVK